MPTLLVHISAVSSGFREKHMPHAHAPLQDDVRGLCLRRYERDWPADAAMVNVIRPFTVDLILLARRNSNF